MNTWSTKDKYRQEFNFPSNNEFPVIAEMDIVVIGGGPAGIAAAETSSRLGLKTLIIEKYGFCGGAAVAGLSGTICGLYMSSEKNIEPEQIVFGFAEKFKKVMSERNGLTEPLRYGKTFVLTHDPLVFRESADYLLTSAKVNILYHTSLIGVISEDGIYKGVIIDTKSGIGVVKAKVIIDASGDADVAYRSGLEFKMGDNGKIQNPTMIFRLGGVNVDSFLRNWGENTISPQKIIDLIMLKKNSGEYDLPREKIWIFKTPRPNELLVNATRILGADGRDINVTDPIDHTEAEIMGRRQVREYFRFLKNNVVGCENSFVNDTGVEVGVRQTRTICGVKTLMDNDVVGCVKTKDGIVKSAWPIELHSGEKPKVHWMLDDFYTVPFGALIPERGENLIVAGRNLSAEHNALASARVVAQCFEYGHAAGTAAYLAVSQGKRIRDVQVDEVIDLMKKNGSVL